MRQLLVVLLTLAPLGTLAQLRTYPPDPRAGEEFVLQTFGSVGNVPVGVVTAAVEVAGAVRLNLLTTTQVLPTTRTWASVVVRILGPGSFPVILKTNEVGYEVGIGQVTIGPSFGDPVPQFRGLSASWYNAAESGWGVNMIEGDSGRQLFAVWFDHGNPMTADSPTNAKGSWLVMPSGRWITPTTFRGVLYETEGRSLNEFFVPVSTIPRGYASFTFLSPEEVEFTAQIGYGPTFREVTRQKRLRRLAF